MSDGGKKVHPMFAAAMAKRGTGGGGPSTAVPSNQPESVVALAASAASSNAAVSPVPQVPEPPRPMAAGAKRSRSPARPATAPAVEAVDEGPAAAVDPGKLREAIKETTIPAALTIAELLKKSDFNLDAFARWPLPAEGSVDDPVPFAYVADLLSDISSTGSRLNATVILAKMLYNTLMRCPTDLLAITNMAANRLAPAHEGVELGVGDAILQKAISEVCGLTAKALRDEYNRLGDLAEIAQEKKGKLSTLVKPKPLLARGVYATLLGIATQSGSNMQRRRIDSMMSLIRAGVGPEINFIVRALQGKMRIGIADSSVLMSLGLAFAVRHVGGNDGLRKMPTEELQRLATFAIDGVTRAYHEVPSFDVILPVIVRGGLAALIRGVDGRLSITPGIPVKPMLAHATNGITAILDRFVGKDFTCEYKYDGERAQVHFHGGKFAIFSRNSEQHTDKYPDVIEAMPRAFDPSKVTSFILDSEVVAIDKETEKLQAFQVLQHRGRKNIKLDDVTIEVSLFGFDLLYFNGESLLSKPLAERRKILRSNFIVGRNFRYAESMDSCDTTEIQDFLDRSIADGCEGLMVKTLQVDADYTPFKRSYHWLKLKKDYVDGAGDTLDLIVMGGYHGKGKRTGVYGGFLLGCYDPDSEEVQSVCKIGTGFSDTDLVDQANLLQPHIVRDAPPYFRSNDTHKPDVWFNDAVVWEIKAADLTISPVHHAAMGLVDPTKGIALRFPRFMRHRDDKGPADATSASQVANMYRQQALAQQRLQEEQDAKAGTGKQTEYDM